MAKATEEKAAVNSEGLGHQPDRPVCGLVMPIAGMAGYDATHFLEVRTILERAVVAADYEPRAVWEGGEADIIHDRIVVNLFENPIIVCDVSGLNPNVMLELGIRLSFAKPTIIVTDDVGRLPFDTKIIEHIPYPRDLHLLKAERFMHDLTDRIRAISEAVTNNTYKPFIRNFRQIEPGALSPETRSPDQVVLDKLEELGAEVRGLRRKYEPRSQSRFYYEKPDVLRTPTETFLRFPSTLGKTIRIVLKQPTDKALDIMKLLENVSIIKPFSINMHSEGVTLEIPTGTTPEVFAELGAALHAEGIQYAVE